MTLKNFSTTLADIARARVAVEGSLLFGFPLTVTPDGSEAKRSDDPGPRGLGELFAAASASPSQLRPGSLLRFPPRRSG